MFVLETLKTCAGCGPLFVAPRDLVGWESTDCETSLFAKWRWQGATRSKESSCAELRVVLCIVYIVLVRKSSSSLYSQTSSALQASWSIVEGDTGSLKEAYDCPVGIVGCRWQSSIALHGLALASQRGPYLSFIFVLPLGPLGLDSFFDLNCPYFLFIICVVLLFYRISSRFCLNIL